MRKPPYELSAGARLDLFEIWNFLAEHSSLDVADRVVSDLESAMERIVLTPGRGHRCADLTKRDVLFYLVHSYLIVYRPKRKPLHILRVLHAARDINQLLRD